MMSHIFRENIFMSPFPSFEVPKMSGLRTNTDSSSIINREYLLESSLHQAPISLWLDFRYKEKKKKRNRRGNGGKQKSKIDNNTNDQTDVTLFYFTTRTVFYSAKKFMFSSQLTRKYRYLDRNGEVYLGLFLVQNVLWSTLSTSCVSDQSSYFSQYSFYKQTPSDTARIFIRQCAPTFKLRHLDLNLTDSTQVMLHLLQDNGNKKSNSNNGNDSIGSSILFLCYLIIERVFQTDGECIVIRFSTLIDRKKRKKLSSKHENRIDDDNASVPILQMLLNCINKNENDNVDVSVLDLLLNLKNDIEEDNDIATTLVLVSKLLNRNERDRNDSREECVNKHSIDSYINERVLINPLSITSKRTECQDRKKISSKSKRTECQDRKKISSKPYKKSISYNTDNNKVIDDGIIDGGISSNASVLIPSLKRHYKEKHTNSNKEEYNEEDIFDSPANSVTPIPNTDCEVVYSINDPTTGCIVILVLRRTNSIDNNGDDCNNCIHSISYNDNDGYNHTDDKIISILLSKLSNRSCTVRNETRNDNNDDYDTSFLLSSIDKDTSIIEPSILILLSKLINKRREEEEEEKEDEELHVISVSLIDGECLLVLLSKLSICNRIVRNKDNFQDVILSSKHNDDDNNNMSVWTPSNSGEYIYIQVLLKRNNSTSIMIQLLLNHNNNNNNRKCIVIFLPNHIDEECNLIILSKGNYVSVTIIDVQPSIRNKKEERDKKCVIIILSKLSQCTISNKEERDDANMIDSVLLLLLLLLLSNRANCEDRKNISLKHNDKSIIIDTCISILLSKRTISNKEDCDAENITDSILIREERGDENSINDEQNISIYDHQETSSNDGSVLAFQLLSNCIDRNKKKSSSTRIIGTNVCILLSNRIDRKKNKSSSTRIVGTNVCILLLSKRTNSDYKERDDKMSIDISNSIDYRADDEVILTLLLKLSNSKEERGNENIIDNNKDRSTGNTVNGKLNNNSTTLAVTTYLDSFINNDDIEINKMKETTLSIDDIDNNDYTLVIAEHTNIDCVISFTDNDKYEYENETETTTKMMMTTTNCNTTIKLSDGNSIDTSQLGLSMGSVCKQLFCLVLVMGSHSVLATCIQEYDYDIIPKALCVFNCSILYWIFTIDGEYQNLQRIRILVDDISLYESSWSRALRLESYLSNSKQQQAAKRGKMSQILHVM